MTAGIGLNGQINVFKSLSPVRSQVVSHHLGGSWLRTQLSCPVQADVSDDMPIAMGPIPGRVLRSRRVLVVSFFLS